MGDIGKYLVVRCATLVYFSIDIIEKIYNRKIKDDMVSIILSKEFINCSDKIVLNSK